MNLKENILLQLCHTSAQFSKNPVWSVETLEKVKQTNLKRHPNTQIDIRHRREDFQGNDVVLSRMEISEYTQLWLFAVDKISMEDIYAINAYYDLGGKLVLFNNPKAEKNYLKYLDACRQWFEDPPDSNETVLSLPEKVVFIKNGHRCLKNKEEREAAIRTIFQALEPINP